MSGEVAGVVERAPASSWSLRADPRRWSWWGRALGAYLATRAFSAVVLVAVAQFQVANYWTPAKPSYLRFTGLMWDATWYRTIAEHGYPAVLPHGADGLVQAWASRHDDGTLSVLLWNHTLDQSKTQGDAALTRTVRLELDGVDAGADVTVTRLDADHGDVTTLAARLGVGDWPTDEQWEQLEAADSLTAQPAALDGNVLEVALAQPSAVLVRVAADS